MPPVKTTNDYRQRQTPWAGKIQTLYPTKVSLGGRTDEVYQLLSLCFMIDNKNYSEPLKSLSTKSQRVFLE